MTVAQQIFDKSWPLGKNGAGELIPGAAVLQERNGLDEPITLAASFQLDTATGQFLPTSKDLPLEVRVRELERLIGALAADPDALSILGRLKALADRLGDAVATPAAYTVLARLAAVEKKLADLETLIQGGIQLKGSNVVVRHVTTNVAPIAPGDTKAVVIQARSGYVGALSTLGIDVRPSSSATTGYVSARIFVGSSAYHISTVLSIRSKTPTTAMYLYQYSGFEGNITLPTDISLTDFWEYLRGIPLTENIPIEIWISNTTDQPVGTAIVMYRIKEEAII